MSVYEIFPGNPADNLYRGLIGVDDAGSIDAWSHVDFLVQPPVSFVSEYILNNERDNVGVEVKMLAAGEQGTTFSLTPLPDQFTTMDDEFRVRATAESLLESLGHYTVARVFVESFPEPAPGTTDDEE